MKNVSQNGGIYVIVKDNNVDKALKQFKRKVKDSGLMIEIRDRQYFTKPSILKREKNKRSLSRIRNINNNNNN